MYGDIYKCSRRIIKKYMCILWQIIENEVSYNNIFGKCSALSKYKILKKGKCTKSLLLIENAFKF